MRTPISYINRICRYCRRGVSPTVASILLIALAISLVAVLIYPQLSRYLAIPQPSGVSLYSYIVLEEPIDPSREIYLNTGSPFIRYCGEYLNIVVIEIYNPGGREITVSSIDIAVRDPAVEVYGPSSSSGCPPALTSGIGIGASPSLATASRYICGIDATGRYSGAYISIPLCVATVGKPLSGISESLVLYVDIDGERYYTSPS